MMGLVITLHIIACVLLIIIILIQAGKGGGLLESFSSVESMFGPKTSVFLTKATTVFAIMFFFTCLTLAILSARQSKSIMRNADKLKPAATTATTEPTAPATTEAVKTKPETTKPENSEQVNQQPPASQNAQAPSRQ